MAKKNRSSRDPVRRELERIHEGSQVAGLGFSATGHLRVHESFRCVSCQWSLQERCP